MIYNSNESYDELLTCSNKVLIHEKYLHCLATEICKNLAHINPDFMKPYFIIKKYLIIYKMDAP